LRVRFFVPEPLMSSLRTGETVAIGCDGCPTGLTAEIVFVSPEAEFTPPVIFGPEERAKLVFMVEAAPTGNAADLLPGQPVSVTRTAAESPP
ncbi:MAG TPA: secretion protein HlyD, partial [Alphaproteobacteria bacterium]|nr:secretion protein HlyD [Alphaproteobacteria bacterium]